MPAHCPARCDLHPPTSKQLADMRRFQPGPPDPEGWIPNTDVFIAKDGHLVILVELAGMAKENVELTIEGNRLRACGERLDGCLQIKETRLATELQYGPFESVTEIPPEFDLSKAKAAYQNGMLQIDVPRKAGPGRTGD